MQAKFLPPSLNVAAVARKSAKYEELRGNGVRRVTSYTVRLPAVHIEAGVKEESMDKIGKALGAQNVWTMQKLAAQYLLTCRQLEVSKKALEKIISFSNSDVDISMARVALQVINEMEGACKVCGSRAPAGHSCRREGKS